MELFGEQISTKEVKSSELFGKNFGVDETLGHEHVFTNKFEIRNYDCNWSEECFKTLWEFGSTQITWVHCDEDTASDIKWDLITLKDESFFVFFNGISDTLELYWTYRQYFWQESVELIEASPASTWGQPLVNVAHGFVVHFTGAVEDVNSLSKTVGQIFGGLSFTSPSRASRSTSHLQMECLCGCDVDSVSKWSNDESWSITQIFIRVPEFGIGNPNLSILLFGLFVCIPIELKLWLPLEGIGLLYVFEIKLLYDISWVGIEGNQTHNFLSQSLW